MPLAPDMVRGSLDVLSRALEESPPSDIGEISDAWDLMLIQLSALRQMYRAILEKGTEGTVGKYVLQEGLDTAGKILNLVGRVKQPLTDTAANLLPQLETIKQEALAFRAELEAPLELLERPWPPIDRAMLEESRRGGGEDLADILARVRAGGPISED